MFYGNYIKLCQENGVKPYSLAKKLGFGSSIVAQWQKGSTPRGKNLQKIADYFSVPISFFYEEEKPAGINTNGLNEEKIELLSYFDHFSPELQEKLLGYAQYLAEDRKFQDAVKGEK